MENRIILNLENIPGSSTRFYPFCLRILVFSENRFEKEAVRNGGLLEKAAEGDGLFTDSFDYPANMQYI